MENLGEWCIFGDPTRFPYSFIWTSVCAKQTYRSLLRLMPIGVYALSLRDFLCMRRFQMYLTQVLQHSTIRFKLKYPNLASFQIYKIKLCALIPFLVSCGIQRLWKGYLLQLSPPAHIYYRRRGEMLPQASTLVPNN